MTASIVERLRDMFRAAFGNLLSRFAPSLASRLGPSGFDQAQVGSFVKIRYVKIRLIGPETCESIWVRVEVAGSLGFVGTLANEPVCPGLEHGHIVAAAWRDVLDTAPGEGSE